MEFVLFFFEFLCILLYSTLLHLPPPEDAGIEPRTVATLAAALSTRLDLIYKTWLDLNHNSARSHPHEHGIFFSVLILR
jgi:hypothetical protein